MRKMKFSSFDSGDDGEHDIDHFEEISKMFVKKKIAFSFGTESFDQVSFLE